MLDKLVNGIDCGIRAISEVFAGPVYGYCRLETVDDDVLVADDGSLVSLLRLEGSLKHVGVEEYGSIVSGLTENSSLPFPSRDTCFRSSLSTTRKAALPELPNFCVLPG